MKTTFLNTSKEKRTELRKVGRQHLESRSEDFKFWMNHGCELGDVPDPSTEVVEHSQGKTVEEVFDRIGTFFDYGLAVDYVTPGTFKNKAGYLRYQLSYGGPSEEVRFYFTPNATQAYKIEFVYLDWSVGVGFDVTNEDWAKWLFDWFNGDCSSFQPNNILTKQTKRNKIMKTFKTAEEVLSQANDGKNQDIKGQFVGKHVYCNVNTLVEYCLNKGFEDPDSPISLEEIENYYFYPEWSGTVLGESLYFEGGSEEDKETFLEEFDRLTEESERMFETEEISEVTHERNLELIEEARQEVKDLETEPAEIFEWWTVSSFLYGKLKEMGYCVVDVGSCYVWGRTTTGQAILLDGVISRICADMGILQGQENDWSKQ